MATIRSEVATGLRINGLDGLMAAGLLRGAAVPAADQYSAVRSSADLRLAA
jgi:hypothetical protein